MSSNTLLLSVTRQFRRRSTRHHCGVVCPLSASYTADSDGVVDLAQTPAQDPPTQAPDPMYLIWGLRPENDTGGVRFVQNQVAPLQWHLSATQGDQQHSITVQRTRLVDGVRREVLHQDDLRGVLFHPQAAPKALVLVLTGSGGGVDETTAALLARHGYLALALGYFAYADLPTTLTRIPLEYFERAIAYLRGLPDSADLPLLTWGKSRGGELALLLGAYLNQARQVNGVIAYVPSSHIWSGFGTDAIVPAWTYRGQPLPYVPPQPNPQFEHYAAQQQASGQPIALRERFLGNIADEAASVAEIPVERVNGPILLIAGGDDAMWPGLDFSQRMVARLQAVNFTHAYELAAFPGAGHQINAPYHPATITAVRHPVNGAYYAYGGHAAAYAEANQVGWQRALDFLAGIAKT